MKDDALLEERHRRGADLDAEVAASDHHRVGLVEDLVERLDRLRLLDLRDHARRRAVLADDRLQVADVGGRAHERQRHEIHAEPERELEIVDVLLRERRNRQRDAGQVHALVRLHLATDDHAAARATLLDVLDGQPDVPVVDQDVVAGRGAPR